MTLTKYPLRTCQTLHECCLCNLHIMFGQKYYDGGIRRRAHVQCAKELHPRKKR